MQKRSAKAPVPAEVNPLGLTDGEQVVLDKLLDCYGAFLALDREHPDELREFVDGVHRIQNTIGMRVLRRSYPKGWPTFGEE